ncbi:hypothetical protein [Streptomyces sp. NPDC094032]|uniref:hypothetical protein n=1 Tax=Streptomyces sp. NPDC094032 TaxID=3155308 RepID=UPI00331A977B
MATAKRTQPTPPASGTRPSVRVDDQLAADLAVVMRTGANFTDAVRQCVRQVADMYRLAWAEDVTPVGTAPVLLAYQLQQAPNVVPPRPTPAPPATSGYDARRTPPAPAVGHPAAPVGPPSAPLPGRGPSPRRSGPFPGVPVRRP